MIFIASNKKKISNTSGNLNNSGFSVEKDGWVYYLGIKDSNSDGIYRVKANSNKKEKVSSDYGLYLNTSGKYIYYLEMEAGNYNIVRINGKDKETIISDVDTKRITVIDNWIYYFKESKFYRSRTNGEDKQIILTKSIDNYEIVGNWIYYSYVNNGKYVISKVKTNGDNVTVIDKDLAEQFFVKDSYIYYIYKRYNEEEYKYNYELYKIKTNGKNKEKIADLNNKIQLDSLNFDGDRIFYTKSDDNGESAIYSIDLKAKNEIKIVDIQGYYKININGKWIYYTDQNENGDIEVFRIRKNGKDKQSLSI